METIGESMADVRRELAEEETLRLANGGGVTNEVSLSQFLLTALELEDQQRAVERASPTASRRSTMLAATHAEHKATLQRKIARWLPVQATYMPAAVAYRQEASTSDAGRRPAILVNYSTLGGHAGEGDGSDDGHDGNVDDERTGEEGGDDDLAPESLPSYLGVDPVSFDLLLPSALPGTVLSNCSPQIIVLERRLRLSQLEACLQTIRRLIRIKASVRLHKNSLRTGQKTGTRSHSILSEFDNKINATTDRYRYARSSLLALNPRGRWQNRLLQLATGDLRAPHLNLSDVEDNNPHQKTVGVGVKRKKFRSEKSREISWIWRVRRMGEIEQEWVETEAGRVTVGVETEGALEGAPQEANDGEHK